jgi:hypothetical protein
MSASLRCVSWNPPIGLPHWTRVFAYSSADPKHERAAPIEPHTMPNRASVRQESGPFMPVTPGSTASPGNRTSSRTSSEVTLARSESLRCTSLAEKPGVSVGTRNPQIPSSVRAHTNARSATLPLVIHIFVPESTQSSPSRRALVRMAPGSEPASGSVGRAPNTSPRAIGGSHRCFCSSEPNLRSGTRTATLTSRTSWNSAVPARAPGTRGRSSPRSSRRTRIR